MNMIEIAVCIVGLTEIIKNIFNKNSKLFKIFAMLITSIVISALYVFVPEAYQAKVFTCLTGISCAVLAYDALLKKLINLPITYKNDVSER